MIQATVRLGGKPTGKVLILPLVTEEQETTHWAQVPDDLAQRARAGGGPEVAPGVRLVPAGTSSFELVLRLEVTVDAEANPFEWYRRAGATCCRTLRTMGVREACLVRHQGGRAFLLEAFSEGFQLAAYRFLEYLPEARKDPPTVLTVAAGKSTADRRSLGAAEAIAGDVAFARDLVNRVAEDLNPRTFAAAARALGRRKGLTCQVTEGRAVEKQFPALHAVGRGSRTPPCMIRLDWKPPGKAVSHVVLVGKGITYDSGGYHVKPLESMFLMKKDMAGGAAVLAATDAAARLGLPVRVTCLVAAAENMISRDSFRPGDVIGSRAGKSIEIRSTDAEGRLVLADALTLATELKPDAVVDLATLTGAAARFMGPVMSPLMGNHEGLAQELLAAGAHVHERLCHLPLYREFREATRGVISDLRNWGKVGGFDASTMVAGGFLSHFVGETPWAHVDMSNASWANADQGYLASGGTAFGVRFLVDFLVRRARAGT